MPHLKTLVTIYLLLLPVGQRGETCERSKKRCSFRSRGALDNSTSMISDVALQGFYAAQIDSLLAMLRDR